MMQFKSKVDELLDQLRAEGKVTELSDAQVAEIDRHISAVMRVFRLELAKKQAQSAADTAKIVLTDTGAEGEAQ